MWAEYKNVKCVLEDVYVHVQVQGCVGNTLGMGLSTRM